MITQSPQRNAKFTKKNRLKKSLRNFVNLRGLCARNKNSESKSRADRISHSRSRSPWKHCCRIFVSVYVRLFKRPIFTALAIISMALGIGANTAIFSLIDTVLLRPLPVREPSKLIAIDGTLPNGVDFTLQSFLNYKDYRERSRSFDGMLAYRFVVASLSHNGVNERVWGFDVSGNYFDVLGVKPVLGRAFLPEEDRTPGFASGRCVELCLLAETIRRRSRSRRANCFLQQSSVHCHRCCAERFCRHRSRVCAGIFRAADDGETNRARQHLARSARQRQSLCHRSSQARRDSQRRRSPNWKRSRRRWRKNIRQKMPAAEFS